MSLHIIASPGMDPEKATTRDVDAAFLIYPFGQLYQNYFRKHLSNVDSYSVTIFTRSYFFDCDGNIHIHSKYCRESCIFLNIYIKYILIINLRLFINFRGNFSLCFIIYIVYFKEYKVTFDDAYISLYLLKIIYINYWWFFKDIIHRYNMHHYV